jgi:dihydroorotase
MLSWSDVARVMSSKPAEIGRLGGYETPFAVGSAANLTLVDPSARREFSVADLHGRSVNSPYLGRSLPGRVVATLAGGRPTVLDGVLLHPEEVRRG